MWYNPVIYTAQPPTELELLWAIYQQLTAGMTLAFAIFAYLVVVKFLGWFLPKFWNRVKN